MSKVSTQSISSTTNRDTVKTLPLVQTGEPVYCASSVYELSPLSRTRRHCHADHEIFIVLEGEGNISSDAGVQDVRAGDVVHLQPYQEHGILNISSGSHFRFLSLSWQEADCKVTSEALGKTVGKHAIKRKLITATPPTPNGRLHLGHVSGPYLAADILRRASRQRGTTTHLVSGLDNHQSYVELKAIRENLSPFQVAEQYGDDIIDAWQSYGLAPDTILKAGVDADYKAYVVHFFQQLHRNGHLISKNTEQPYCKTCDRFLFEAHTRGKCPFCYASCDGNACEACGHFNDCTDIQSMRCRICSGVPVMSSVPLLYLCLERYRDLLLAFWEAVSMPPHMRSLVRRYYTERLPDVALGHISSWGIPMPFRGFEQHTFSAWAEMAAGYHYVSRNLWTDEEGLEIIQCFGFDNTPFHALLIPALWLAFDRRVRLPDVFVGNEFLMLDGEKFSTSREHAIWALDALNIASADSLRFTLAALRPGSYSTNFTWERCKELVERTLNTRILGMARNVVNDAVEAYKGRSPDLGLWMREHYQFITALETFIREIESSYDARQFSSNRAVEAMVTLAQRVDDLRQEMKFLELELVDAEAEHRTGTVLCLTAVKYLVLALDPIAPMLARRVGDAVGLTFPYKWEGGSVHLFGAGALLSSLEISIPGVDLVEGRA